MPKLETTIPLIDEILSAYNRDLTGYRNHVYRMVNFCFAQGDFSAEEREKIVIAGAFHDLGIWTADTFDYLPPSIALAKEYLDRTGHRRWQGEVSQMIDFHHRIRHSDAGGLVETFRRGDLIDFSLGLIKCGLSRDYVREVKSAFPNHGFHRGLVGTACRWIARHPLNPLPVVKW